MAEVDSRCVVCGKCVIENDEGIECENKCKRWFHIACVKISKTEYRDYQNKRSKVWKCNRDDCGITLPSLGMMMEEIVSLKTSIKDMLEGSKKKHIELIKSVQFISDSFEAQKTKLEGIECTLKKLSDDFQVTKKDTVSKIHNLEEGMEELQQYSRRNNLEIHGIPEQVSENVNKIVMDVAKALDVELKDCDIDAAHRLPSRKTDMPRPVIVRFVNRWKRDMLIGAKKKKKHLTTEDIKISGVRYNIYINEHLTSRMRNIHKRARGLRQHGYGYIWTKDCRVFVKRGEGDRPIWIRNEQILQGLEERSKKC